MRPTPQNQVTGQIRVDAKEREAVILFQIDPGPPILFGPTQVVGQQTRGQKIHFARGHIC